MFCVHELSMLVFTFSFKKNKSQFKFFYLANLLFSIIRHTTPNNDENDHQCCEIIYSAILNMNIQPKNMMKK